MDIIISNASDKPIYEQITIQLKNAILSGQLAAGEALPSIRALANDLRVSVITTKRAYTDLEAQGFIDTVPGKGCFVTGGNVDVLREERLRRIEAHLQNALDEAKTAAIDLDELHSMLDVLAENTLV
ncbi:MAG: GntR family transcriptional regulator [Coriobacteriales bacterium]|nr:GntR family transcriptional regulator [Coriobacteriales bacterium]